MEHKKLKPCPFCGGKAEIRFQPLYTFEGVRVRCTECSSSSRFVSFDCNYIYYHGEKNVFISKDQAINDVIDLWNRRANGEIY